MHDATKVLLGTSQSSHKKVTSHDGAIEAGLIVRVKSDDTLSIAAADGQAIGISLGKDMSDLTRTAICRKGLRVPVQLTSNFTPNKGAAVSISDTTGKAIAAGGGATVMNANYATSTLTGTKEDGTTCNVALIDFPGGL
jgi:hypothetical protein